MLAVQAYQASVGQTLMYAILIGIPTAIIAGPVFAKFIVPRIQLPDINPLEQQFINREPARLPQLQHHSGDNFFSFPDLFRR